MFPTYRGMSLVPPLVKRLLRRSPSDGGSNRQIRREIFPLFGIAKLTDFHVLRLIITRLWRWSAEKPLADGPSAPYGTRIRLNRLNGAQRPFPLCFRDG